jgi:hypothetical protein
MDNVSIDFSSFTGSRPAESLNAARQQEPDRHLRPQQQIVPEPSHYQKQLECAGGNSWGAGSAAGGTWAGRSR